MYGTIFNLKIKPGHQEDLLHAFQENETPDGMIAWFLMDPDNQDEWVGVAVFENKDKYVANASSATQHEAFLKMMEHLESEPQWIDGEYLIGEIA